MKTKHGKSRKKKTKEGRCGPPKIVGWKRRDLERARADIETLDAALEASEKAAAEVLSKVHPSWRSGARELVHRLELTKLEGETFEGLARLGLAKPGCDEGSVRSSLQSATHLLESLISGPSPEAAPPPNIAGDLADQRMTELLGAASSESSLRLMATVSPRAADGLIGKLMAAGVEAFRITTCGANPPRFSDSAPSGSVVIDLDRRRPRLGETAAGPAVLRWEPRRNALGKLLSPARLWLTPSDQPETPLQPVEAVIPVRRELVQEAQTEDWIRFKDARGRRRELRVRGAGRSGCLAENDQTTYLESNTPLRLEREDRLILKSEIGDLPRVPRDIRVWPGDPLVLSREPIAGLPAARDGSFLRSPAKVGLTMTEVFDGFQVGERVVFGDGEVSGVVTAKREAELDLEITSARAGGSTLEPASPVRRPDGGGDLPPPSLSGLEDWVRSLGATAVVLPIAENPREVVAVHQALETCGGKDLGLILGIETLRGIENLPRLLLEAMRRPRLGILIAVDDLVAECGAARLVTELERLRRLAKAVSVPVLWSTPFLTRASRMRAWSDHEMQDLLTTLAGDCAVLGAGRHQVEAVERLGQFLRRE